MFRMCLKRKGEKKKKKKRNEMTTATRLSSIREFPEFPEKKDPPITINAAKDKRTVRDTIPFMMSWNLRV